MTATPHPYPAYKPSGVEWLGDVPSHWDVVPTRALLKLKKQLVGDRADKYTLLSLTKQGIIARDMENPQGKFPASFETYQVVEPGDLVFCLFDIDETPRTIGLSSMTGMITGAYTRFVCPNEQNYRFIHQLYLSLDNGKLLKPLYSGLRKVITKSTFLSARIPLPPLPEQRAIVRYLDHADRRIRRYVAAKRKLMALLEEEKQAVVNQAVTRGLDSNVRVKPSDVEWLGDVPEHWEVRRAKFLYREADERSTTGTEELMSVSHITGVTPRKKSVTMFMAESSMGYKLCRPGDIVINTMWAFMAALGVARQIGLVSPSYGVYRQLNIERLSHDYIDSLLRTEAYRTNYLIRSTGITSSRLRLYPESFLDIPLLCPPSAEQAAIVEHLERATADTNAAIARAQRQTKLVEEYRTRLIADVVTGKLDVRAAAGQLPDEADEEEPIDGDGLALDNMDDGSSDVSQLLEEEQATEREVTA